MNSTCAIISIQKKKAVLVFLKICFVQRNTFYHLIDSMCESSGLHILYFKLFVASCYLFRSHISTNYHWQ